MPSSLSFVDDELLVPDHVAMEAALSSVGCQRDGAADRVGIATQRQRDLFGRAVVTEGSADPPRPPLLEAFGSPPFAKDRWLPPRARRRNCLRHLLAVPLSLNTASRVTFSTHLMSLSCSCKMHYILVRWTYGVLSKRS